jgi:hypothetical protein
MQPKRVECLWVITAIGEFQLLFSLLPFESTRKKLEVRNP